MSFESNILLLNVFLARLVYPYGKEFMPYKFTKLIKTNKIAQLIICFLLIYFTFEISDNINSYKVRKAKANSYKEELSEELEYIEHL